MLTDKLRDGAHGKVFKILFWIIILSFIFAGVGNYLIPKLNTDPVKIGKYSIRTVECSVPRSGSHDAESVWSTGKQVLWKSREC